MSRAARGTGGAGTTTHAPCRPHPPPLGHVLPLSWQSQGPQAGLLHPVQHLHKDGEKDDCDDGREEQVTHREVLLVQEVAQGEGDGPSQAPVGNDELVLGGQLHDAELVDKPGQDQHACQGGEVRSQTVPAPHGFFSWEISLSGGSRHW